MEATVKELTLEYVAAVSDKRFDRLAELVHPEATFGGTVKQESTGANAFIDGFRNLAPILLRSEVRSIVAEEDRAFVMYDFVTDTPAGAVLCGELLTFDNGRIRSSTLIFDWRRWPEAIAELQRRQLVPASS